MSKAVIEFHEFEQGSDEWREIRKGRITGTKLKRMLSDSTKYQLMDELIAERITGFEEEYRMPSWVERGNSLEPEAKTVYTEYSGYQVHDFGFITNSDYPEAGLSPDGLVGDDGAIEVKCPMTKNHVKTIRTNRIPSDYKPQILLYFILCPHIEWVDFMSYDPRFEVKPYHIIRATRDSLKEDIDSATLAINVFSDRLVKEIDRISF